MSQYISKITASRRNLLVTITAVIAALCILCVGIIAILPGTPEAEPTAAIAAATLTPTSEPTATAVPSDTPAPTETHTPQPTNTPTSEPTMAIAAEVPAGVQAQVVDVIDGDTIDVNIDSQVYRVRYIGMDTPEVGMPYYEEATAANSALVSGQTVILVKDVSETDRYDRLLRYVYLPDGTFVNAELVREGYAQVATFPPDVAHQDLFSELQTEAREASLGLWSSEVVGQPAPTEPPPTTAPTQPPPPTAEPTQPPEPAVAPTEPPAPAPAAVVITYIFYNGDEPDVEGDEYAVITNQGGSPVNLSGWRLNAGSDRQDFKFPAFDLQPGQSCRVYTNRDIPETCGFSFRSGKPLWNNKGDCGYLFDATGAQVSEYCYS